MCNSGVRLARRSMLCSQVCTTQRRVTCRATRCPSYTLHLEPNTPGTTCHLRPWQSCAYIARMLCLLPLVFTMLWTCHWCSQCCGRADYRRNIALSSVKTGYTLLCKHAATLIFVPLSAVLLVRPCCTRALVLRCPCGSSEESLCVKASQRCQRCTFDTPRSDVPCLAWHLLCQVVKQACSTVANA
jgi:hypothetical protein